MHFLPCVRNWKGVFLWRNCLVFIVKSKLITYRSVSQPPFSVSTSSRRMVCLLKFHPYAMYYHTLLPRHCGVVLVPAVSMKRCVGSPHDQGGVCEWITVVFICVKRGSPPEIKPSQINIALAVVVNSIPFFLINAFGAAARNKVNYPRPSNKTPLLFSNTSCTLVLNL